MDIVVYCSSKENLPDAWQDATRQAGAWIGRNNHRLVYGGVNSGLMKIVARAAKDAGATIVGIVPARRRHVAAPVNDILVPASDLNDRKGVMQMLGDIFLVLPGGYGTLDEFTTSFSYLNFTNQRRPIVIFNPDGIFDPLLSQLDRMTQLGLLSPDATTILSVASDAHSLIAALTEAQTAYPKQ